MTNVSDLSVTQLKRAVEIKEQIEKLESELSAVFGSTSSSQAAPAKGGMSEATKAKLRAASKARWAKINADKQSAPVAKNKGSKPAAAAKAAPKKTTMSPAARKKISDAAKARWAAAKASGKKGL